MSVVPTSHAASHGAEGNDPITSVDLSAGLYLTVGTAPATPDAGKAVLYLVADGLGHSLSVKFDDGSVVELADNV
jgi:hypothetical protein